VSVDQPDHFLWRANAYFGRAFDKKRVRPDHKGPPGSLRHSQPGDQQLLLEWRKLNAGS